MNQLRMRRSALAEKILKEAGGLSVIDQLTPLDRFELFNTMLQAFQQSEGCTRGVAKKWILQAMDDYRKPSQMAKRHVDTEIFLGSERRSWLNEQGGIQETIARLVDEAMRRAKPGEE